MPERELMSAPFTGLLFWRISDTRTKNEDANGRRSGAMNIERLTEEDLPGLSKLYEQFWGEVSSLDTMRETFKRLAANTNYILLVAKLGDAVVGSVMGVICEELYGQCKPFMVVEDVIVDRAHRRGGVGTQLMRQLENEATQHGCSYIIFVTESERTDACQFYASIGYRPDAFAGFKKRLGNREIEPLKREYESASHED